ncbi:MAG TPA: Yip1 family protein [Caulobacteraceae bacterium]|nr:Yip1 family protein [Caulobacteraceae bacterium]
MSVVEQPSSPNLMTRALNILVRPRAEWELIETEPATTQGVFIGYACILAAIPAIARAIGGVFGVCVYGFCIHANPAFVVVGAVAYYVVSLAGVYVIGLIIDALAPNFGGQKNQLLAMKVAVYSFTAYWLAGIFAIFPPVAILGLLGLYSFYLLYLGLPRLMKAPADKALGYTVVSIVLGIVVFVVAQAIGGAVANFGAGPAAVNLGMNGPGAGTVSVGGANVNLGRLQAAAQQMASAARQAEGGQTGGKVVVVDPVVLKGLLPGAIAGVARTDVSDSSGSAGGIGGSSAEATYQSGDRRITLTVTDLGAAGAVTALAGAFDVNSERQTPTGYEKISTAGGRMVTERYDNQARSGEYAVVVAHRFTVAAEGSGVGIGDLKAAVAAVGPDRLAAMAHG